MKKDKEESNLITSLKSFFNKKSKNNLNKIKKKRKKKNLIFTKIFNVVKKPFVIFKRKNVQMIGRIVLILFECIGEFITEVFKAFTSLFTLKHFKNGIYNIGMFFKKNWSIACAVLLVGTFIISSNVFAVGVKVVYGDDVLGYATDKEAISEAVNGVEGAITTKIGKNYSLKETPKYELSIVSKKDIDSSEKIYDKLYNEAKEDVGVSYALQVDGKLIGVASNEETITTVLEKAKAELKNKESRFVQDVTVEKGMFPKADMKTTNEFEEILLAKPKSDSFYVVEEDENITTISKKLGIDEENLEDYNGGSLKNLKEGQVINTSAPRAFLALKEVNTITYTTDIDYNTIKKETSKLYKGETEVEREGQKGEYEVKAEVTIIDGEETDRKVISKTKTKDPVDKVLLVGTKAKPKKTNSSNSSSSSSSNSSSSGNYSDSGSGSGTGRFIRPVSGGYISSPYGARWGSFHPAIDIAVSYGTPIKASDSGTVISAGWNSTGYGKYIRIRHGNGYETAYAHCSAINVIVGQKVSKGQVIGRVGSTGNSTGNHVHFEIWVNGSRKNPSNYI